MVGLTTIRKNNTMLANIVKQEVVRYAGNAHQAKLYPILDDVNQTYAVVIVEEDPAARPAWVVVMAQVVDEHIIIEEDTSLDKNLVDALVDNGSIPREQIVLAYMGETLPESRA